MNYVDGFVLPVPKTEARRVPRVVTESEELWKRNGALEYVDCFGDDIPPGKVTSFPPSVS